MKNFLSIGLLCLGLILPLSLHAQDVNKSLKPKHDSWDNLLKQHVDEAGWVDYAGFENDRAALNKYLDVLQQATPTDNWTREERLAYYINVYNAYTVELILRNYPVKSIKDIKTPWKQQLVRIGDKNLSLNDVEHEILRKMDEPRIHFAINCASVSCPRLLDEAFTAEKLEGQLDRLTREFLNSDKNRYGKNVFKTKVMGGGHKLIHGLNESRKVGMVLCGSCPVFPFLYFNVNVLKNMEFSPVFLYMNII